MSIAQIFLGSGPNEIEPTIPVGGLVFTDTDTRSYPGNGVNYLIHNETWTVPDLWKEKTYEYKMQTTSTADYICFGFTGYLYKNGVLVASWSQAASNTGYYRYNSGTLTHTQSLNLKAGDVLNAQFYGRGRNVGGSTPSSTVYHQLQRTT